MRITQKLKRFIPAAAIFFLVTFGLLQFIPNETSATTTSTFIPTVVFSQFVKAGTKSTDLSSLLEIRMLEPTARAAGSVSAINEIPQGVLVVDHVEGQQLLATSIASNVVDGLGAGFVAVSVAMDTQRWLGPLLATGTMVDVYEVVDEVATRIARNAVVLNEPPTDEISSSEQMIISLGIPGGSLNQVLVAATENRLWLVGIGK